MFSFAEELKWYEPGLETVEESLSGNEQKDLIELIQMLMKTRAGAVMDEPAKGAEEGTQLAIEDALEGAEKEAKPETEAGQPAQEAPAAETEETKAENAGEVSPRRRSRK